MNLHFLLIISRTSIHRQREVSESGEPKHHQDSWRMVDEFRPGREGRLQQLGRRVEGAPLVQGSRSGRSAEASEPGSGCTGTNNDTGDPWSGHFARPDCGNHFKLECR